MSDWTAPAFIDALVTAVAARSGITALTPTVNIRTIWLPPEAGGSDEVMLYGATDINEPAALGGGRYEETVTISGQIRIKRPGASETVAKAGRDRIAEILGEFDAQLRTGLPQVGDQTISGKLATRDLKAFADIVDTTAAVITITEFTIVYKSRTS